MSCAEHDQMLIERYLDGELPPALRARAEAVLEHCAECRTHFEEFCELRLELRASIEAAVDAAPLGDLWARLEPQLTYREDLASETAPSRMGFARGLLARWRDAWGHRRLELALGGLAAACAVLVVVWMAGSLSGAGVSLEPKLGGVAGIGAPSGDAAGDAADVEPSVADNRLVVEETEVREGSVVIDIDPDDPSAPAVVWHLVDSELMDNGAGGLDEGSEDPGEGRG